ncbi:set domain protein [Stagonosporopsis vannaccii]|nr:set domain protein [Stagonosporopsis vannaccii]
MPVIRHSGRNTGLRFEPYDYGPCPSPVAQDKYFHTAHEPTREVFNESQIDSPLYKYPPSNITALCFDPTKWQDIPRPANYLGPWPPTSASELMDTHLMHEDSDDSPKTKQSVKKHGEQIYPACLGKHCWQNTDLPKGTFCVDYGCTHTFTDWLTGAAGWQERFELRNTYRMDCGLYSKCKWTKGDILGVYIGELVPLRPSDTEYCHEVVIGPAFEKTEAPVAYVDAMHYGNYVRFCNNSCENNANICEARVGNERVLALRATKRIAPGEQVTVDYEQDYFRDGQCLCGSARCKYSGRVNDTVVDSDNELIMDV